MKKAIATRSKDAVGVCVCVFVLAGALFGIALGVYLPNRDLVAALVFLTICGGALFGYGVVLLVRVVKTPKIIVYRENDRLYFPKFSCMVWEIDEVSALEAWSRYYKKPRYGKLYVTVAGKKWIFHCVSDVESVAAILSRVSQNVRKNRKGETNG